MCQSRHQSPNRRQLNPVMKRTSVSLRSFVSSPLCWTDSTECRWCPSRCQCQHASWTARRRAAMARHPRNSPYNRARSVHTARCAAVPHGLPVKRSLFDFNNEQQYLEAVDTCTRLVLLANLTQLLARVWLCCALLAWQRRRLGQAGRVWKCLHCISEKQLARKRNF